MPSISSKPKHSDLANRTFENPTFALGWVLFLFLFLMFISWPIRNALLVCWVYGREAYSHRGIRVLPGKPIRFSNGFNAPLIPDLVTGFGIFFATTLSLSFGLFFALRLWERIFGTRSAGQR